MDTKKTVELYKSTQSFLNDLNEQLLGRVYEAIDKATEELEVNSWYFRGLHDWLRAPFGRKPSGCEAVEKILRDASRNEGVAIFFEDVFMGSSHRYEYSLEEIKVIAKYL